MINQNYKYLIYMKKIINNNNKNNKNFIINIKFLTI